MAQVVSSSFDRIDAPRNRREVILWAARQRDASRVRVFCSVARGEAGPSSSGEVLCRRRCVVCRHPVSARRASSA